jgi:hypothetical protein
MSAGAQSSSRKGNKDVIQRRTGGEGSSGWIEGNGAKEGRPTLKGKDSNECVCFGVSARTHRCKEWVVKTMSVPRFLQFRLLGPMAEDGALIATAQLCAGEINNG